MSSIYTLIVFRVVSRQEQWKRPTRDEDSLFDFWLVLHSHRVVVSKSISTHDVKSTLWRSQLVRLVCSTKDPLDYAHDWRG
jgi:hypothetical protein